MPSKQKKCPVSALGARTGRSLVLSRRQLLRVASAAGVALVAGCKPGGQDASPNSDLEPLPVIGLRTFSAQEARSLEALCDLALARDPN